MSNTTASLKKKTRFEIRIAGAGGQGIILAGIILAEAGTIQDLFVAQGQNYGPETRGGNSTSEVILSRSEIDFPRSTGLDILLSLTQLACDRNLPDLKENGLLIVDTNAVKQVLWEKLISIPFGKIAQEVGEDRDINMAALGSLIPFCPFINRTALVEAINNRLPSAKSVANLQAIDIELRSASSLKDSL